MQNQAAVTYEVLADQTCRTAGLRRGEILAILPTGRIVVLDYVVTHPAAALYIQDASQLPGFLQQQRQRLKTVAHLGSLVLEPAMISCRWLLSLMEVG